MTSPPPGSPERAGPRWSRWLVVAVAVVAVLGLLALAAAIGYIFFRPAGPPPVGPDAPAIPESWLSGSAIFALNLVFA